MLIQHLLLLIDHQSADCHQQLQGLPAGVMAVLELTAGIKRAPLKRKEQTGILPKIHVLARMAKSVIAFDFVKESCSISSAFKHQARQILKRSSAA